MNTRTTRLFFLWMLGALFYSIPAYAAGPDLIIQDIWTAPDPLVAGQTYTFYARVVNQGDTTASSFIFSQNVDFYVDGGLLGSASYDDVLPGGNVVVSINATAPSSPGTHQFRADADASDRINETNEVNNSRIEYWSVTAPDLVVTELWTVPATPTNGQSFIIYATVANQGSAASGVFSVGFYLDDVPKGSQMLGGLGAGQSGTVSILLATPSAGSHQIRVCADDNNQVPEIIEGNNCRTVGVNVQSGTILRVHPNSLSLNYSPSTASFTITNAGGGVLFYTNTPNRSWITTSPLYGNCSNQDEIITVNIDVSGLLIGTSTGAVNVASSGGSTNIGITVNIADDDGDQIPDGWEVQNFGSTANCNPNLDSDGDGQNNRQEWIGGSNPTNKLSAFAITGVELSPGKSNVVIHWPTLPGRLYDVYWSSNAAGPYLCLGTNLPPTQTHYSDTTSPQSGFYRVNVKME